jgi:FMN reductase
MEEPCFEANTDKMNIVLLAGSPSPTSRSTRLLQYVGDQLAHRAFRHIRIQVSELPADALLRGDFRNPELELARNHIAHADAVVIATPVYQAAYSGLLKVFLDLLPQDGLAGKLVLPLATGGSQSHMLVLDYALRPVLASLGARHILPSIYATEAQIAWDTKNGLSLEQAIVKRIAEGVAHLSASLLHAKAAAAQEYAASPTPSRYLSGGATPRIECAPDVANACIG